MKLHWLLPGYLGMFLLALPAEAAKLQSWRFDEQQNRLEFRTDEGVQPKAQLIANPTRLVLDLPGTTLGRPMVNQSLSGAIRSVRVGQFDRQTTRIVIELAPGYTLDPAQVKVRGLSPTQWTVDLPTPQRVAQGASSASQPVAQSSPPPTTRPAPPPRPTPTGATQLESVQVTPDGFFVRVSGRAPELKVRRSSDRRKVTIDLPDSTVSPQLAQPEMAINRFGVNRLLVTQEKNAARITLEVDRQAPEFRAIASNLGGVVIIPTGNVVVTDRQPSEVNSASSLVTPPSTASAPTAQPKIATIEGIDLRGNQLVIQANEALTYTTGWDRETNAYRIALPSAQLAEDLKGPTLDASSPLLRIRLRQEDDKTVAILLQPAAGVRIGQLSAAGQRSLSVPLERSQIGVTPPPGGSTVQVPTPTNSNQPLPTAPRGRIVVVIDPGHGGPDPGAVGINGLSEVDIVDPISQEVASLLERQGVQAILTRRDNIDLGLEPRVALAERVNATLFVSIHANAISMSRPEVNGLETYYYSSGERLARTIHSAMLQETGARDRGVRQARFYVLRRTSMPAVLIETGFVTGREDAANLSRPEYRSRLAAAIARGILQYIQQN